MVFGWKNDAKKGKNTLCTYCRATTYPSCGRLAWIFLALFVECSFWENKGKSHLKLYFNFTQQGCIYPPSASHQQIDNDFFENCSNGGIAWDVFRNEEFQADLLMYWFQIETSKARDQRQTPTESPPSPITAASLRRLLNIYESNTHVY